MKSIRLLSAAVLVAASSAFAQPLDISGYKIIQTTSALTFTFPPGSTIERGGYVIVARNSAKASFESSWGVTLGATVRFINGTDVIAGNGFPTINGDENFTLQNASSVTIDGPTVQLPASPSGRTVYQKKSASGAANDIANWTVGSASSPGSGVPNTNSAKLLISEIGDDAGSGNFIYEFIELFYDTTPPTQGFGTASVLPSRWKYNVPTTIQFVFKSQSDTVKGLRIRKPGPLSWSATNITVQPASAVKTTAGDSTTITNIALVGSDSLVVSVSGVTAADTTDEFSFDIRTSSDGLSFLAIQTLPKTIVYGLPRSMAIVKQKDGSGVHRLINKWAVVRGIVIVGNEFGGPSYLQDATAAIAVFDSSVSNNVDRGDDVILLGLVAPFNDLFELTPCTLLEKISEGNPVDTLVVTAAQITVQTAAEPYESRLLRVNGITSVTTTAGAPVSTWAVSGSGTNYNMNDGTGTLQTRISPRVNLANQLTPNGKFDMVGVLGQFSTTYQLMPRFVDDIILEGSGPRLLTQPPYESNITSSSLRFAWQTDVPSTSTVRYGKTTAYGSELTDTNKVTQHSLLVTGLSAASIYNVQLASTNAGGTTTGPNAVVSTSSKTSSGVINVYFNKSVNTTLARIDTARTDSLLSKVLMRINAAKFSIDCALYSLSGTVGSSIANALIAAKNRGVKVRMIVEKDNLTAGTGTTFNNIITPSGIPWIADNFDPVNNGAGLHHNKFFVFDNRDTTSDTDDWVMMGSWNPTDSGTNDDRQNAVEIQDQALSNAFTTEFNEMWGSSTDTQNAATSRFGARKLDNTPHLFIIGGVPVESYFSPSDRTTSQIIRTLNKAQHSINMALLLLTRSDIATALKARKDAGVRVRGVLDGSSVDASSQYNYMITNGMDIRLDNSSALLHHKYAIINGENSSLTQYVITGSHNWSSAAENSNNENTLIIQSNRIANLYLQEFAARYKDNGGTDNIVVSVKRLGESIPRDFSIAQNYPNPFNPSTNFEFKIPGTGLVELRVYDVLGREVATLVKEEKTAGVYHVTWDAGGMASGVYLYRMTAGAHVEAKKMLLLR